MHEDIVTRKDDNILWMKVSQLNKVIFSSVTAGTVAVDGAKVITRPVLEKIGPTEGTVGCDVSLETHIRGLPQPQVDWYKGSIKIKHGGRYQIDSSPETGSYSLLIKNVEKDDEGSYKCVASNQAGTSTCRTELTVKQIEFAPYCPYEIDESQIVVYQEEELNIVLPVKAYPKPIVKWYKDDEKLSETRKIRFLSRDDNQILFNPSSLPGDSGVYRCEVVNELGSLSKTFDVKVKGELCSLISILSVIHSNQMLTRLYNKQFLQPQNILT